jgi:hypothetical protein
VPFCAGRRTDRYDETSRNRGCLADAPKMGRQILKNILHFLLLIVVGAKVQHFLTLACNNILNLRDTSLRKGAGYNELRVTSVRREWSDFNCGRINFVLV